MPEHDSWFSVLPGLRDLTHKLEILFGKTYITHSTPTVQHVWSALVVLLTVIVGVAVSRAAMGRSPNPAIPDDRLTVRNFFEIVTEAVLNMMSNVMGRERAREFLPLVGSLAFFIFFSNILGLIPGFQPATGSLNTTLAPAAVVFLATHIYGVRKNGIAYFKHFLGPVWWLAPLMLPLEIISHCVRPVSLSLRLLGNIFGDHTAGTIFFGLVPLVLPIPLLLLGVLVAVVQTLVFCLLSTVYIAMAVEAHEEDAVHAEGAPGHEAAAAH
jgi:F-type H+-transporting ATPase subunit a